MFPTKDVETPLLRVSSIEEHEEEEDEKKCNSKVILGFVVGVLVIALGVYLYMTEKDEIKAGWHSFIEWCKGHGTLAVIFMFLGTWIFTSLCLPAALFFVASACIFTSAFDPTTGTIAACLTCGVGFWLGCACCFQLGRTILKPFMESKLEEFAAMKVLNSIIDEEGWKFAFLIRLSPFIPVEALNPASAMTNLTFKENLLASMGSGLICMVEVYAYCQAAIVAAGTGKSKEGGASTYIMIGINVVIVILLFFVIRKANKSYHDKVAAAEHLHDEDKEVIKKGDYIRKLRAASHVATFQKVIGVYQARRFASLHVGGGRRSTSS